MIARHPALTPAQDRVMRLVCEGLSADEIATRIGRTERVVRKHKDDARHALNAPSLAAAAARYSRWLERLETATPSKPSRRTTTQTETLELVP
jgi:DNA-binding CsgD family transcriptional regulator